MSVQAVTCGAILRSMLGIPYPSADAIAAARAYGHARAMFDDFEIDAEPFSSTDSPSYSGAELIARWSSPAGTLHCCRHRVPWLAMKLARVPDHTWLLVFLFDCVERATGRRFTWGDSR